MSGTLAGALHDNLRQMAPLLLAGCVLALAGIVAGWLAVRHVAPLPRWRGWWPRVEEMREWDE